MKNMLTLWGLYQSGEGSGVPRVAKMLMTISILSIIGWTKMQMSINQSVSFISVCGILA